MKQMLLALALLLATPATARPHGLYEAMRIVEGVHLLFQPPDNYAFASSNVTIVEQADGMVVIDSGTSRGDGDAIVRYIRALTPKPVKALVFTHWHNDHIQGATQLRAAWPRMRIIATDATRKGIDGPARSEGLGYTPNPAAVAKVTAQIDASIAQAVDLEKNATDPGQRRRYARMIAQLRAGSAGFVGTHLAAPTETVVDALTIPDPVRPVEIRFLGRANTDGDLIAWLPEQRVVAAGDMVVSPIPFGFGSYPGDWIATLGKLRALGFEMLIPGHGLPQSDTGYIDRLIESLTDIRTQVGTLAAQGLTLAEVRAKVDFARPKALFGTTRRRAAGIDGLWLHPMIENVWKEAKGIPIVQGEGALPD